jgi:hypothetical protein
MSRTSTKFIRRLAVLDWKDLIRQLEFDPIGENSIAASSTLKDSFELNPNFLDCFVDKCGKGCSLYD